jgi:hypothetical protein
MRDGSRPQAMGALGPESARFETTRGRPCGLTIASPLLTNIFRINETMGQMDLYIV